jgi:Holliday junction resolvase RusA-like endonuclease
VIYVLLLGIPPSPNALRRMHWATRAAIAREWRHSAWAAALEARNHYCPSVGFPWLRANVKIVIVTKTATRRDPDNAVASVKPLIDGLVDAGIIADDSFTVIADLSIATERGLTAGVRIEVEQLDSTEAPLLRLLPAGRP